MSHTSWCDGCSTDAKLFIAYIYIYKNINIYMYNHIYTQANR